MGRTLRPKLMARCERSGSQPGLEDPSLNALAPQHLTGPLHVDWVRDMGSYVSRVSWLSLGCGAGRKPRSSQATQALIQLLALNVTRLPPWSPLRRGSEPMGAILG